MASVMLAPTVALAGGGFHGGAMRGGAVSRMNASSSGSSFVFTPAFAGSLVFTPAFSRSFAFTPTFPRTFFPRRFFNSGVPIVYAPAPAFNPFYDVPPAYYDTPPVAYAAPPSSPVVAVPPPPPPPEREAVQYADGRYELRGDGIATPYRWVWIPNAPPPPSSGRDSRLYGWVDEQGGLHVTDRWETVPEEHRAQAKRNQSS